MFLVPDSPGVPSLQARLFSQVPRFCSSAFRSGQVTAARQLIQAIKAAAQQQQQLQTAGHLLLGAALATLLHCWGHAAAPEVAPAVFNTAGLFGAR